MQLNASNIGAFLKTWHEKRNLARTDLLWLCNEVLGFDLVVRRVHGPIIDALQHFQGANEFHQTVADYIATVGGKVMWEPKVDMALLPPNAGVDPLSARQTLILFPRGHIKSTLATVAHSVQWILNYPNVRILITTATGDLVTDLVRQIRELFISNETLRFLFPELCPRAYTNGGIPELGNLDGFFIPGRDISNRKLGPGGKDLTVKAATVGKAITGYHGDVQKNDDMVEKINSSSLGGIIDTIRHAGSMGDLLEKYPTREGPKIGWVDVIGTPWDNSDYYQVIRNAEAERAEKGLPPRWNMAIRSAAPNWTTGKDRESKGPYLYPELCGYDQLLAIEEAVEKGPAQLFAQYLMNPIVLGQGLIDDVTKLRWMPALEMDRVIPKLMLRARMDLAGMDPNAKGADNDYTALTVGGFDEGTLYIPWTRYGRPPTEEVVEWIFEMFAQWPGIVQLTVEKASGGSQIEAWLRREMASRGKWLPVTFVTRSNQQSKVTRIKGLRPWFMNGKIAMSDAIPYRLAIENEVKGFPKYRHNDWLDTVSDLMMDSKGDVAGGVVSAGAEYDALLPGKPTGIEMLIAQAEWERGVNGFDTITGWAD